MNPGTFLLLLAGSFGQMDDEFHCGFGGGELNPALNRIGPDVSRVMRSDSGGLRITLPPDRQDKGAVGIEPRFRISGDFEITVGYEILSVDTPSTGMGAGLKVWGRLDSDQFQAMNLGRMTSPEGASAFCAVFAQEDAAGKRRFQTKEQPTDAKRGRLRLVRTGSELSSLVAEEEAEEFQELQRVQVGTGDVLVLRISGTTSGDACGVSLRLLDLRIRADTLPDKPTTLAKGTGGWFIVWLLVVAGIGTGGFLLWRYRLALWEYWPWRR